MKKDINIRIDYETYKLLAKEAKKEDRTIKSMIRIIVSKSKAPKGFRVDYDSPRVGVALKEFVMEAQKNKVFNKGLIQP